MNIYITRKIPEIGIKMLTDRGHVVDINPHDRPLTKSELIEVLKSKPYDAVLTLLNDKIDAPVFDSAPSVKIFANYTIGYDNFDVEEGQKRGVFLTNARGGGASRVAEHVWALILALTCRVVEGDDFMRAGKYTGWDPMLLNGLEIRDRTLGLIGAGRIGSEVARIGIAGFAMKVLYHDVAHNEKLEKDLGVEYCDSVDEILKQADIVSLHVPLLETTRHLINADRLKLMKPTAYLINTSRGPVVDEVALVEALKGGVIAGAGLDVYEHEPELTNGLIDLSNVILTPHIASATRESRDEMAVIAVTDIIHTLDGGKPINMVYN